MPSDIVHTQSDRRLPVATAGLVGSNVGAHTAMPKQLDWLPVCPDRCAFEYATVGWQYGCDRADLPHCLAVRRRLVDSDACVRADVQPIQGRADPGGAQCICFCSVDMTLLSRPGDAVVGSHAVPIHALPRRGTWTKRQAAPRAHLAPKQSGMIMYRDGYDPGRTSASHLVAVFVVTRGQACLEAYCHVQHGMHAGSVLLLVNSPLVQLSGIDLCFAG